jgi:hypothetical protein
MVVVSVTVFDTGLSKDSLSSSLEQPVVMAPTKARAAMLRNFIVFIIANFFLCGFITNFVLRSFYNSPIPRWLIAGRNGVAGAQSASQVSDNLFVS